MRKIQEIKYNINKIISNGAYENGMGKEDWKNKLLAYAASNCIEVNSADDLFYNLESLGFSFPISESMRKQFFLEYKKKMFGLSEMLIDHEIECDGEQIRSYHDIYEFLSDARPDGFKMSRSFSENIFSEFFPVKDSDIDRVLNMIVQEMRLHKKFGNVRREKYGHPHMGRGRFDEILELVGKRISKNVFIDTGHQFYVLERITSMFGDDFWDHRIGSKNFMCSSKRKY